MSSESRVIRPFPGGDYFQKSLIGCFLSSGDKQFRPDNRIDLSHIDFATDSVEIVIAENLNAIESAESFLLMGLHAMDLSESEVSFHVSARTAYLKIQTPIWSGSVAELRALDWKIQVSQPGLIRPEAMRASTHGYRLDLSIHLNTEREPGSLRAWRRGTWLGKVSFSVANKEGSAGFTPLILDQAARERFGLTEKTLRYVLLNESPLEVTPEHDAIELYLDEAILTDLEISKGSSQALAIQNQLVLDIAAAIIMKASSLEDIESVTMDDKSVRESLIGQVVKKLAGKVPGESENELRGRQTSILHDVRKDPLLVIARFEATTDLKRHLHSALNESSVS